MKNYDSIIIGGGHNALVCANYLAKSGQKVLIIEALKKFGGLAADREFFPGYRANTASALNQFSEKIASDLNLSSHGFNSKTDALKNIALDFSQNHVYINEDSVSGVSEKDAHNFNQYKSLLNKFADALKPFWLKSIPRLKNENIRDILTFAEIGLKIRLMGKKDMREFLRIFSLPTRDLMDEFFDSDLLKAALSWDALIGSSQAPRSPNNSILTLLYRMSGKHQGHYYIPTGGIDSLIDALVSSAEEAGVEFISETLVKEIIIKSSQNGLKAIGVKTHNSDEIKADRIISGVDPKQTFINLVGAHNTEIEFSNRINRLRSNGYVAKFNLALSNLPSFKGLDSLRARMLIVPNMDSIEFAWDDAKYGDYSQNPVMDMIVPTLFNPSMAPEGKHTLSANIMYIPYQKNNGWSEEDKNELTERIIDTISQYSPNIRDNILHSELLTPLDLEKEFNLTGGHWHRGELALDQMLMMRPTYEAAQYCTPIDKLYLCSAGCHPGGGIMGAAGYNAAKEIIK